MKEIVKEAQNRFDYWIMEKWQVLPTDERFLNLTEEQRDFLWENFLLDHPEIQKQLENRFYDPEFDKEWEKLDKEEDQDTNSEDLEGAETVEDEFIGFEDVYKEFLDSHEDLSIEDKVSELRDKIEQNLDNPIDLSSLDYDEWEEVDD